MTIKDWMDYCYECFPICDCSQCIYKYACEQTFHCGAEIVSEMVDKYQTRKEIRSYINRIKNTRGKTWSMSCNGKGIYEREGIEETTK